MTDIDVFISLVEGEGDLTVFVLHAPPDQPYIRMVWNADVGDIIVPNICMPGFGGRYSVSPETLAHVVKLTDVRDKYGIILGWAVKELFESLGPMESWDIPEETRKIGERYYDDESDSMIDE